MFLRFTNFVLWAKWPLLLFLLLSGLLMGGALFRLKIDPSMESLFLKDSPEYQYYRQYRQKYGSDKMIALAMSTPDLFSPLTLQKLKVLTAELARFEGVERVLSLANAMDIRHKRMGVKVEPALGDEDEEDLKELRRNLLTNELFVRNLISPDGKIANLLIYLKSGAKHESAQFMEVLQPYLKKHEGGGVRFFLAGSPVEQYEFIRLIRRDQFTFVPLIAGLLIVTTFVIYRSFTCMILSMSIVFLTLTWTLGTIAFLGEELNLMTSLLAPVIMIVSVINSVYLINCFFEIRPRHPSLRKAVTLTIDQLGIPCLLTHLTAILGFLSLALNPIPAIRSFGTFSALGTFYSFILEILLTVLLFPTLPYRPAKEAFTTERNIFNDFLILFLEKLEFRWQWWILAGTLGVALLSYQGLQKIEVDTNMVKQMRPDVPLAVATRFIDDRLTGVYSLGFVLRRRDGGSFVDGRTLAKIDGFKTFLESRPEIPKVNSITTLIKKIHEAKEGRAEAYRIPSDPGRLKRYFRGLAESKDPELWNLISRDFREVRIEARMKAVGTREGARVEETARQYLEQNLGRSFDYELTGNVVLLGRMAKDLVEEQVQSFTFALISILTLIILIFRSVRLGLIAAIPNLIPILAVYGLMGWVGIELSTPTAMVSSIVLGLVVDASIQFLYRYRLEFAKRGHYLQALHHTYRNIGHSMVISTLILVTGFASSIFASFKPTIYFGLLTSLTILLSLFCTLVIVPVCVVMTKPFGRQRLFQRRGRVEEETLYS